MIPHPNFEMFDDSAHEYYIHPLRLSVLTEYLSLSLTYFRPLKLVNHFIKGKLVLIWVVWNKNKNKFMFDQSGLEKTFIVFV